MARFVFARQANRSKVHQIPFGGPLFVLALAGIRRLVVQIEPSRKDDLFAQERYGSLRLRPSGQSKQGEKVPLPRTLQQAGA